MNDPRLTDHELAGYIASQEEEMRRLGDEHPHVAWLRRTLAVATDEQRRRAER